MSNDANNPPHTPDPDDTSSQETHAWGSWDQLGATPRHESAGITAQPASDDKSRQGQESQSEYTQSEYTQNQYLRSQYAQNQYSPNQQAAASGRPEARATPAGWENTGWSPQPQNNQANTSQGSTPTGMGATAVAPSSPGADTWNQPPGWEGTAALSYPSGGQGYAPQNLPIAPASSGGGIGGFFRSLFDFSFHSYITPSIVKVLYILTVIGIALYWIGSVIFLFILKAISGHDSYDGSSGGGGVFLALGILDLLFGWIVALVFIALARMQYEYMVALIRTSEYARDIKAHLTGDHRTR